MHFLSMLFTTLAIQNYHSSAPDTCVHTFVFKKQ